MPDMETAHPLSIPFKAGRETLCRCGANTEACVRLDQPEHDDVCDLVTSAHAPFSEDGKRLNIACTDEAHRCHSLAVISEYTRNCMRFPNVAKVICHLAPRVWYDNDDAVQQEGTLQLLIDGLRQLADLAAEHNLEVMVENNRAYFRHQFPNAPVGPGGRLANDYWGTEPDEWRAIVKEVARANLKACLDTSHAATVLHRYPEDKRLAVLDSFLAEPELIGHVHWSDSEPFSNAGRDDMHLCVGEGAFPKEFHRRIAALDATLLLEHFYDHERLDREIEFIRQVLPRRA